VGRTARPPLRTLAELRSADRTARQERRPGFADAAGGDYTLDASSPLVDAGVLIPGIDDDFGGTALTSARSSSPRR